MVTIEEFNKIEIVKYLYRYYPQYDWETIYILFHHKISTKEFSNLKENSIKAFRKIELDYAEAAFLKENSIKGFERMLKKTEIDYDLEAFLDLIHECYKKLELIEGKYCELDIKYYIELIAYHYILSINFKDYMIENNSIEQYNILLNDLKFVIIKKFKYINNFPYYFFQKYRFSEI